MGAFGAFVAVLAKRSSRGWPTEEVPVAPGGRCIIVCGEDGLASGGSCRTTFLPGGLCMSRSALGATTAPGSALGARGQSSA